MIVFSEMIRRAKQGLSFTGRYEAFHVTARSNLNAHQIFAEFQGPGVGLARSG
jgi:hypothetical protein